MNGKQAILLILALGALAWTGQVLAQNGVESLRGVQAIDTNSKAPQARQWQGKTDPIARNYKQQPPLIPHKSQSFKINLKSNKCMGCHVIDSLEKSGAPRPSETHFVNRDGKKLDHISALRYFCTQCHVEQRDAVPLVGNDYAGNGDTP